jgi:DNA-binding MarR family transcriptional regulator
MSPPAVRSRPSLAASGGLLKIDASTAVELDEVLQFMRVLWVTVHALQKASKRMNRHLGVTGPQRLAIRVIGLSPGISAGGLARILHLHPSTLTGILKRLEAQGVLSRVAHSGDARRAVLHLTSKGARLNVAMEGTVEAAVRGTIAHVDRHDQHAVRDVLTLLADRLDALRPPARTGRKRPGRRTA